MMRRGPSERGGARAASSILIRALATAAMLVLAEPHATPVRGGAMVAAASTSPARDERVQTKIASVASATSEQQLAGALAALRAVVAPDFSDLVPQLAVFLLDARDERAGMTPALIVDRLGVTRGQILRAVEPYLDTPDARLRAQLENLLGAVELADVRALVVERGGAPPSDGLVRHLYERSPVEAIAVLAPAAAANEPERRTTSPAVTLVEAARVALASGRASDADTARAAAALDALSRDPDWRLRAYAAAVLRSTPALREPDGSALGRLEDDALSPVRAVARDQHPAPPR